MVNVCTQSAVRNEDTSSSHCTREEKQVLIIIELVDSKGAFALATRFDPDSIQFHRNPIQSTWILSALKKLLTAHDFVTSRPAYVSREFAVSVLLHRAMTFDLLLLISLLLPSFT